MANPEHIEILASGIEAWNLWREDYPQIQPDLTGLALAPLSMQWGVDNGGPIDFAGADLRGAVLTYGNLHGARLMGADCRGTKLAGTRLVEADLSGADFSGAFFRGANFRDVKMDRCALYGADLTYVFNLEVYQILPARFDETTLVPFDIEFSENGVRVQDKGVLLEQRRGGEVDVMPGVTLPPIPDLPPLPEGPPPLPTEKP